MQHRASSSPAKSRLPATPAGWVLSRLKHEASDVVVELCYQQQQLFLILENSKTVIQHPCQDLAEAKHQVARLYGQNRSNKIFTEWHEVSYRRSSDGMQK